MSEVGCGMPPDRWKRVQDLFDTALEIPTHAREEWLREQCGDDDTVAREVLQMLAGHDRRDGILDVVLGSPTRADIRERLSKALAERYEIEEELGHGGMATVFLAHEKKHARKVVLKVMKPEAAALFGAGRFLREVHIAAQLSHPHILGLIDSGDANGLLFYVMPNVEGETLRDSLRRTEPVELGEALTLLRDVADALAYAHRAGVVHRDLKPDNILCVRGHAFLMDFGIAKILSDVRDPDHTADGVAIGTPTYMAPEQAEGSSRVDHRADLYAWGILAHEMFTGKPPFSLQDAGNARQTIEATRPDVPQAVIDLVSGCLEPSPDKRIEDAETIVRVLEGAITPVPGQASSATFSRKRWGWPSVIAAVAILTAVLIGLGRMGTAGTTLDAASPIAVAALTNETGDSSLTTWGRLAGDWITQGLQETGLVTVIPWPTALRASEHIRRERAAGRSVDPVALMRSETDASLVITGAYYLVGDDVRFQVEVTDASTGSLLGAPAPVVQPRDSLEEALRELRERVMGTVAIWTDERAASMPGLAERPPRFDAYRVFDRALDLFLDQRYRESAAQFDAAFALDTAFVVPLIYAAIANLNSGDVVRADSIIHLVEQRRGSLSEYHELLVLYLRASLDNDNQRALQLLREARAIAPASRGTYNLALIALRANRPREALHALEGLDPDRGELRGWSSYWTQLTHALHLLGLHSRELKASRELRARYPGRRVGTVLEARALGAAGQTADLDSLLVQISALPPNTYWSQGAAMVVAGEELLAHGDPVSARPYFERAVAWFANQLASDPDHRSHRYWLGSVLFDQQQWDDAWPYFESLVSDYPDRTDFRGLAAVVAARVRGRSEGERILGNPPRYNLGAHTAFRARLAAVTGDIDRAVDLFSEALQQGIEGFPWWHAAAYHDLALLADDPRFQRLMAGSDVGSSP